MPSPAAIDRARAENAARAGHDGETALDEDLEGFFDEDELGDDSGYETPLGPVDFLAQVERLIDDIAGVGVSQLDRLGALSEAEQVLDQLRGHLVRQSHLAGASWREIGEGLGISAQAAHKRYAGSVGVESGGRRR